MPMTDNRPTFEMLDSGMANINEDLHGNVPDKCLTALLMIDVINDLEFDEGEQFLASTNAMTKHLVTFVNRARSQRVPVIYVNDNFGRWRSDFRALIEHCLNDGVRGESLVRQLQPTENDYFVLKPKHSGFFSTGLETLLRYLGTKTLILTGLATNICVLFTANDAYMRDFELFVPGDCCAAISDKIHQFALEQISSVLKADIRSSEEIMFKL